VVSGTSQLLGAAGEVIEFTGGQGWALVDGERWQVHAGVSLQPHQRVRVTRVDGLALEVAPAGDAGPPPGEPA
jgi:membrane-bound serine protease (ClpP class)